MKHTTLFVTAFLFLIMPLFSVSFSKDDDGPEEEIPIGNQQGGDGPTSVGGSIIHAWRTSSSVRVDIMDYTGYATVYITGTGGIAGPVQSQINGSAQLFVDISSLAEGFYTITIQAGGTHVGYFMK